MTPIYLNNQITEKIALISFNNFKMKYSKWFMIIILTIISVNFSAAKSQFNPEFQNSEFLSGETDKCTTYVYNLSTKDMRIRNICYTVLKKEHIDLN